MTKRSVQHATFTIERRFPAASERVFHAYADPKGRWFVGPDDWESSTHKLDFRAGGREEGTRALFDNLAATLERGGG